MDTSRDRELPPAISDSMWVSTKSSGLLRGRRNKDTKPELALRRALHSLGARYRLQYSVANQVVADLAFTRHRAAIFVDGCFWHGCPKHGRRNFTGPNAGRWIAKMERIKARDER